MAALVLEGITGYTAPDITVPAADTGTGSQTVYAAAEPPKLEILEQTGEKQVSKGPAEKLAAVDESGEYKDGTYRGSAQGFGGTVVVEVTIRDGKITGITVISASGETGSYFARAKAVISSIIGSQSTNVDAVSGATYSSNGIIKAVRNALKKARVRKSKSKKEKKKKKKDNNKKKKKGKNKKKNKKKHAGERR